MKSKDIRFKVTIGIGLVFVFSIIPLLLVARYNHGWADDYSYGYLAYSASVSYTHLTLPTIA